VRDETKIKERKEQERGGALYTFDLANMVLDTRTIPRHTSVPLAFFILIIVFNSCRPFDANVWGGGNNGRSADTCTYN
jgi:hypothetical protein